ncbi:MAG: choice-of-anchor Q domain-containing protein [Candidatus Tenebribacter burtonii]|jgi:hypothetical protein|nr:choice-of-anchor Q domain-containing protein [Candidatus Tenebribacter burtonii]
MKILYLLTIPFLIIISCSNSTAPVTNYDYHWKISDSPVYIDSCFTVNEGETLKIDSGVEVLFKATEDLYGFHLDSLQVGMILVHGTIKAIGTNNQPIVFSRADQDGWWGNVVLENNITNSIFQYCEMSYFFHTSNGDNHYSGGLAFLNSNGLIENCFFYGIGPLTAIYCNNSSPQIRSNKISLNSREDLERPVGYRGTGIKCQNGSSPYIYNNVIFDGSYSVACYEESNPKIVNNSFTVIYDGEVCIYSNTYSFPEVTNTILKRYDFPGSINCVSSTEDSSILISYSVLMQDNFPDNYTDNGNNIFTDDIGFIEDSYYRLSSDSPCINSGNRNVEGIPSTDIDGNARVVGSNIDIGAYEYQGY